MRAGLQFAQLSALTPQYILAVVQPAKPSGHGSSLPLASSEARCNAWLRSRATRHRANRSRNYRAGLLPSRQLLRSLYDNRRLSDLALYIAPLRPLPAGNPAGPALHNKTLCKLARGNDETYAASAATALKRHTARVLSRWQRSGSFAASTPATSRKALRASAGRCNAHLPRPSLYCLSFIVIVPSLLRRQVKSRRVIWTLRPCAKRS